MADKKSKNEQGVAPPEHEADDYGQLGKIRDMKDKPSPDTVAQEQVLSGDESSLPN